MSWYAYRTRSVVRSSPLADRRTSGSTSGPGSGRVRAGLPPPGGAGGELSRVVASGSARPTAPPRAAPPRGPLRLSIRDAARSSSRARDALRTAGKPPAALRGRLDSGNGQAPCRLLPPEHVAPPRPRAGRQSTRRGHPGARVAVRRRSGITLSHARSGSRLALCDGPGEDARVCWGADRGKVLAFARPDANSGSRWTLTAGTGCPRVRRSGTTTWRRCVRPGNRRSRFRC